MALFSTLGTGASGLTVSSDNLSVIGDNIANINTVGFKGSRASFADMMPQMVGGLGTTATVGRGSMLMSVDTLFGQGSLQSTGNALDMAINGSGLFQVASGQERYYTRDGSFQMDDEGYVVNGLGMRLQGYQVVDDTLTSVVSDLQLDVEPIAQSQTTEVALDLVLSAESEYLDSTGTAETPLLDDWIGNANTDGTSANSETIANLSEEADYSTSITIYDSLGVAHDVTVLFERESDTEWNWTALIDGAEADLGGGTMGDEGYALELASGHFEVDTDGLITGTPTPTAGLTAFNFPGAATTSIDFQLGLDSTGAETGGSMRMADSESYVVAMSQDGYTIGDLLEVQVDSEGVLTGYYSNGENRTLGQVALAMFPTNAGLDRVGGNLFRATPSSGLPVLGAPDVGGRGSISGYALERSNVELEDQFVSMIQAQRTYQANSSVIRTADEALQQLVNLV